MQDKKEILKKYYGYDHFRNGQEELIDQIIAGKDTLGIMPTGAGKSICYQIPAIYFEGTTIVISPLISLMKDQVDSLNEMGISAAFINSTLTNRQYEWVFRQAKDGFFKIIYVAPERLETESFMNLLKQISISQIAIDEAHCVSQWGHDFRPSYQKIAQVIDKLEKRPVISAFTATATEVVKEDIIKLLKLDHPYLFVTSFDRKNLFFSVEKVNDKIKYIEHYIKEHKEQSGIIYCATRKRVEELFFTLQEKGYSVTMYHAGISETQRARNQEEFIYDKKSIMIATNAFGMGIDKSNVRFVIHYNMPASMENYYQEAGRAGRDSDFAECIILFSRADVVTNKFLIEQGHTSYLERTIEYNKLNSMVDYCNTDKCLRKYILEYFGESVEEEKCHYCINCNSNLELVEMTTEAKKILSCIKRMGQKYGSSVVTDVLRGSQGAKMKELKFDMLSTYGIMKDYSKELVREMISFLISEGYIDVYGTKYPLLKLNEASEKILFENERVFIKRNIQKDNFGNINEETFQYNEELFEDLKQLRKEIALENHIPPFIIFSDLTLKMMSVNYPITKKEMLSVLGVGEQKYNRYGKKFENLISAYVKEKKIDIEKIKKENLIKKKQKDVKAKSMKETIQKKSTYEITYELFLQGKEIEDIAKERNLTIATVQGHFMKFLEEKWKDYKKIETYLLENQIQKQYMTQILEVCKRYGYHSFKVIKNHLPEEVSYFDIRYVVWKYINEG